MPLIDLLTDISSFNYDKIEKKHGEYFGEKNATGFTPNRKAGDTTEYNSKSIFNDGLDAQIKTGVDYIDNINATGYTTNRTTKDIGTDSATFAGEYKIGTSEYDGLKSTNFVKGSPTGVNYSENKGFVKKVTQETNSNSEYSDYPLKKIEVGSLELNSTDLIVLKKSRLDIPQETRITTAPNNVKEIHISDNHPYPLPIRKDLFDRYDEIKSDIYTKFGGNAGLRAGDANNPGDANEPSLNAIDTQPFIIKEVLDRYDSSIRYDEGIVRGGALLNGVRVGEDIVRLGKWATTMPGVLFGLKQIALQRGNNELGIPGNARKETRNYNPVGIFGSVTPGLHLPRHSPVPQKGDSALGGLNNLISSLNPNEPGRYNDNNNPPDSKYYLNEDGQYDKNENPVFLSDVSSPFMRSRENEPSEDFGNVGGEGSNIKAASEYGLGSGLIRTAQGKLYSAGVSNTLQFPYGGKFGDINNRTLKPLPKDFVKFRIRDAVNGKWIIFPAHLGTVTDTVSPEWSTEKYIGRPDSVHIYTGANRNVSFNFKVAAFTKQELPIIQEKMNALVGLGYPTFKKNFSQDDEVRPVAPYIYLTIGDLYNNTPGYFSNISLTFEENSTWEIDEGLQIPHYFDVSVDFIHIGKFVPTTISKHFDFPNLQQHDIQYGVFKGNPRDKIRPELGDVSKLYKVGEWMSETVKASVQEKVKKVTDELKTAGDVAEDEAISRGKDAVNAALSSGTSKLKEVFKFLGG